MADEGRVRVLHLVGLDDRCHALVTRLSTDPNRTTFAYLGNVELQGLLDGSGFEVVTVVCGRVRSERPRLHGFDVVLNAVCDADTNAASLDVVERIAGRLGIPVLNAPASVRATTRDRVSELLAGAPGAVVPRTVRVRPRYTSEVERLVADGGVGYPFLFREAGTHGGTQLSLVEATAGLRGLEQFAFDGRSFYATEFADFRSADGLWRKYRTLVIGGEAFPKHLIVSEDWNVHARSRPFMAERPALVAEEERFVDGDVPAGFRAACAAIHDRVGLDYFGVDHGIDGDGRIVVFEVNACFRPLAGAAAESAIASHQGSTARIKEALAALVRRRATEFPAAGSAL